MFHTELITPESVSAWWRRHRIRARCEMLGNAIGFSIGAYLLIWFIAWLWSWV